jgi:hypothetical protein
MVSKERITLKPFSEISTGQRLKKGFFSIKGKNPFDEEIETIKKLTHLNKGRSKSWQRQNNF